MLTPGGFLIDPVDSASFGEAAGVLGDNGQLAQFSTFLFVVSVLLYWFGLHSLNRAFSGGSVTDYVSRLALNVFLVGYAFLVAELSVRHILTHVLEHGWGRTGYGDHPVYRGFGCSHCFPSRQVHWVDDIRMWPGAPV